MRVTSGLLLLVLAGCADPDVGTVAAPPAVVSQALAAAPPPAPAGAAAVDVVLDVMQLVGRSEDEVSGLLGPPASCEAIHRARLCTYPPDGNEVMYAAGKADMIALHGMGAIAFDEDALAALGLEPARPDDANERAIRWTSIPDLEEVTVFAGEDGSVRYAYVKVGKH